MLLNHKFLNGLLDRSFTLKNGNQSDIYKMEHIGLGDVMITCNNKYIASIDLDFKDALVWFHYILRERVQGVLHVDEMIFVKEATHAA